jgi:3-oxoacid CoA-transferase subunit A
VGLGGFYTPTGVGTKIAEGKEVKTIDGREYVLELPLKADFAIVRAYVGDTWGNLKFRKTAKNFSPLMCMAARVTIAEVENLVPVGDLDPSEVDVPSIFVQRVVKSVGLQKWIERRTVRQKGAA